MANLKELLKEKHSGLSPLMKEREKMESDEATTYEQLTLSEVHLVSTSDGEVFAVVTFKEAPNKFYFGGVVLTDIVSDIYKMLGADPSEVLNVDDDDITLKVTVAKSKQKKTKYYNWSIV